MILPSEFRTFTRYNQIEPQFKTDHFSLSVPCTKENHYNEKLKKCREKYFEKLSGKKVENSSTDANLELVINSDDYRTWAKTKTFAKGATPKDCVIEYLRFYAGNCGIQPPSYEDEKNSAREQTKRSLLESFDHVEICHQSYPYPNRYDNNGTTPSFYFHASGKK